MVAAEAAAAAKHGGRRRCCVIGWGASFFGGHPRASPRSPRRARRDASEMDYAFRRSGLPLETLHLPTPSKRNQQQQGAGGEWGGLSRDLANRLFEASNAGTMSLTSVATFNAYVDAAAAAAAAAADVTVSRRLRRHAGRGFTPRGGPGGAGLPRHRLAATGVAGGIGGGGRAAEEGIASERHLGTEQQ